MGHLRKQDAVEIAIQEAAGAPCVFTTGYTSRIAMSILDRSSHFYMVGSMGQAACVGLGVSLSLPGPVVVVDGDGSLAMNTSSLLSVGQSQEAFLLHLVLDDGTYDSTGGQRTPIVTASFVELARGSGYSSAHIVDSADQLRLMMRELVDGEPSRTLLHCRVEGIGSDGDGPPSRMSQDLDAHARRFGKSLQSRQTGPLPDRSS